MATRRSFLSRSIKVVTLAAMSSACHFTSAKAPPSSIVYSARRNAQGQHFCVAYRLDGTELFATQVPERLHDVVLHPNQLYVLFMARRPGTKCYWLDAHSGKIVSILEARANRHFYGHGVFDSTGEYVYLTENDIEQPGNGVIGVYRCQNDQLTFVREFSSYGIEPHELVWLVQDQSLAIANGGLRRAAASRIDLDVEHMQSSLTVVSVAGELLSADTLAEQHNSIRHLTCSLNGTLVCVHQYKLDGMESESLIAIKRAGQPLSEFRVGEIQQLNMNHYSASVAVHSSLNLLAVTAPRGNRLLIWDLVTERNLLDQYLPDCAGLAATVDGFIVSSGQAACVQFDYVGLDQMGKAKFSQKKLLLPAGGWDNHLILA